MTTPQNLIHVTSPDHFKSLLEADLGRVSLLNFWAPWAKPCEVFNKVVEETAAKFPEVLVLMVSWGGRHARVLRLAVRPTARRYQPVAGEVWSCRAPSCCPICVYHRLDVD